MRFRSSVLLVLVASRAGASEPWDAAPFTADPARMLEAASAGPRPTAPAEVLLDESKAVFDAEGKRTLTWRRVIRVLDAKAAGKAYETAWMPWRPWYQERPEFRARVIGPGGAMVELDPKTITESPLTQLEQDLYSDSKLLVAPLPGFVDGAVVEQVVRVTDRAVSFRSGFGRDLDLQERVPVRRARLEIRMPRSLHFKHRLTGVDAPVRIREEGDERIVTMEAGPFAAVDPQEPYVARGEPAMARFSYTLGRSWQAAAKEYSDIVAQAIAKDDLAAEARRVVGDAKTNEDAVDRILRWMKDLRYSGVEFGDAAFVPRSPRETLGRGFGDCKDLATLMVAMLRASGRPASVVLLRVMGRDVSEDLPNLEAFDHAIVRVAGSKPLWVDPTHPLFRAGSLPFTDQGRLALVADARTTRLERIPTFPSSQNLLQAVVEVKLADSGAGSVTDTREGSGWVASWMRAMRRGDAKERRENMERWLKRLYGVEQVTVYEETGCTPGEPCRTRLAGSDSKRVQTGDFDAAAFLEPFAPFGDVLDTLKVDDDKPGSKPRTLPLELPPSVTEVRYHVVQPLGFRARGLPGPFSQSLGPATYSATTELLPDGSVNATFRLDTVKAVYSAAEVTAFRKGLNSLRLETYSRLLFDSEVALAAHDGKTREALDRARALVKAQPAVGAHQARLARALVEAGFGTAAREAARRSTEIAPKDPVVWRALGFVLEHDELGRRFHRGFDRDGAVAAYRKAKDIKAEVSTLSALAWVLEHDTQGERWASGARLEEAVSEYRALGELRRSHDTDPFVLADLFYLGKLDELLVRAPEAPQSGFRDQIRIAALAAQKGVPPALSKAEQLTSSEENRRKLVLQAVPHLLRRTLYPQASALLQVGQGTQADARSRLALTVFPRLKPRAQWGIPPGDPRTVVVRMLEMALAREPKPGEFRSLLSAEALEGTKPKPAELESRPFAGIAAGLRPMELPASVALDFGLASIEWLVSGDAKTGWRVRGTSLGGGDARLDVFVVKEGEALKCLGAVPALGPVGLRALRLLDRGEKAQARQWLTWARESAGEIQGPAREGWLSFLDLSRPDQLASDGGLRTAASVLALRGPGDLPMGPVLEARERAGSTRLGSSLDTFLISHFTQREQWADVLGPAERLMVNEPSWTLGFISKTTALQRLGRSAEAEKLARARMTDFPGDETGIQALNTALIFRGDVRTAWTLAKERVASGRATANDYNDVAWDGLVLGLSDTDTYQAAQRASQLSGGKNWAYLNTHAAVSAASGHPEEARKLLLETLAARGDETLMSADWLVVGLMAEQYGLAAEARAAFEKTIALDEATRGEVPAVAASVIAKARMSKVEVAAPR